MVSVELLHAAELRGIEQRRPIEPGALLELGPGPHLRAGGEVLALLARFVRSRDLGLEVHDPPARACGSG